MQKPIVMLTLFIILSLGWAPSPRHPVTPSPRHAKTGQQMQLDNGSAKRGGDANGTRYQYVFVNDRFTVPRIEVAFDGTGNGQYSFKRKDSEEIINKLTVSEAVLGQIRALFIELNFLDSNENYQHKKDFSHLGTMTITYA